VFQNKLILGTHQLQTFSLISLLLENLCRGSTSNSRLDNFRIFLVWCLRSGPERLPRSSCGQLSGW